MTVLIIARNNLKTAPPKGMNRMGMTKRMLDQRLHTTTRLRVEIYQVLQVQKEIHLVRNSKYPVTEAYSDLLA